MRIFTFIAALAVFFSGLSPGYAFERGQVTASFLPVWIFAENVAKERMDVSLLVPPGTDVHEFTLRPRDMEALMASNLVLINGAGLEAGLMRGLRRAKLIVDTSKGIELLHGNTHVWLDPLNAARQAMNISGALAGADPENASNYSENANAYAEKLRRLHDETANALADVQGQYLVTFHDSFNYFARRYGLRSFSLTGPDAEQPLPRRVRQLYDIVAEEGVKAIFSEKQFSGDVMRSLAADLGVAVCTLDTIETGQADPAYYIRAMRKNARTISRCLKGVENADD